MANRPIDDSPAQLPDTSPVISASKQEEKRHGHDQHDARGTRAQGT
jgi:hypothetical protein